MSINHSQKKKQKTATRERTTTTFEVLVISAVIVLSSIAAAQLMATNNNSVVYAQSSSGPSITAYCDTFAGFTLTNLDPESTYYVQRTVTLLGSTEETTDAFLSNSAIVVAPSEPGTPATFNLYEDIDNDFSTVGVESNELIATDTVTCGESPPPTPAEAADELSSDVQNLQNVPQGTKTSLAAPLQQVSDILNDDNPNNDRLACNRLDVFIREVNVAERRGDITAVQANDLITQAEDIRSELHC